MRKIFLFFARKKGQLCFEVYVQLVFVTPGKLSGVECDMNARVSESQRHEVEISVLEDICTKCDSFLSGHVLCMSRVLECHFQYFILGNTGELVSSLWEHEIIGSNCRLFLGSRYFAS